MRKKGRTLALISLLSLQLMAGSAVATNAAEISSQQIYVKAETAQASSKLQAPVLGNVQNYYYGQVLTWKKVAGAVSYDVYCKKAGGKWSKIATTKSLSYTNKKVTVGATYIYTVRAVNGSNISKYDTKGKSLKYINAPTKTSLSNAKDGIKVTWKKASGAAGYYVYRKEANGKWKKVKTIKNANTVSYTDTTVKSKNGKTYIYCINSYSGKVTNRGTYVTICRLAASSITGTSTGTTSIKVSWKQNSSASGYQICYKVGNSKKYLAVNRNTTTSKTISGLKTGKTYAVYVRSYKQVGKKKVYSSWSGGKSVKTRIDEKQVYKSVLNKYKRAVNERWTGTTFERNGMCHWYVTNGNPFGDAIESDKATIGYCLKDLNGDGVKELLLGDVKGRRKGMIYDAYTIAGGKVKHIIESKGSVMYYDLYYLCENGYIKKETKLSAMYITNTFYLLQKNASLLNVGQSKQYKAVSLKLTPVA